MSVNCQHCTASTDLALCKDCAYRLRTWLVDVDDVMDCLETVVTRQSRWGERSGPRSAATPLYFNADAADARSKLGRTLVAVAHEVAGRRGAVPVLEGVPRLHLQPVWRDHDPNITPTADPSAVVPLSRAAFAGCTAAGWLRSHVGWLRTDPAAGEVFHRIERAVTDAENACVPPAPRWYAGPCGECGHDLLVESDGEGNPRVDRVVCAYCLKYYDLDGIHDSLLRQVRVYEVRATIALSWAHLLLGKAIPRGTWDSWVSRERITARSVDADGRPLFRFGEVEQLARDYVAKPRRNAA